MWRRGFVLVLLVSLWGCLWAQPMDPSGFRDYSGYRILRVWTYSEAELDHLLSMVTTVCNCMIGVGEVDVCVSPQQFEQVQKAGFPFKVLMEDVGRVIREQRESLPRTTGLFDNYLNNDQVVSTLYAFERARPTIAQVFKVGTSIQGRTIYGLRITEGVRFQRLYRNRPAVVINGCQHAREWISVMVPLYIAYQLINLYGTDREVTRLVRGTEIFIIPIVNPDGYVYTWTTDRLWRKNRRNNGGGSYGVDLNRNWGYQWGGEGSSGDPWSEIYRGTAPFSEPETFYLSRWMQTLPNLKAYMDYHSYGQYILWPWGYTGSYPPDQSIFDAVGSQMQARIRNVYGRTYTRGTVYRTLYPASGISLDWGYGARRALSYTIELRDTGQYGFLLPPEQILPTCQENYPAILYLIDWARRRGS